MHDPQVAVTDVPEGSVVQLHVRDPHWARHNILKQIQVPFLSFFGIRCLFSVSPRPAAAAAVGIVQTFVIVDCCQATAASMNLPVCACALLQRYIGHLPEEVRSNPQQLGSLLYSCVTLAHEEEQMLQDALPKSAFQVDKLLRQNHCTSHCNLTIHILAEMYAVICFCAADTSAIRPEFCV